MGEMKRPGGELASRPLHFFLDRGLFRFHVRGKDRHSESCHSIDNTGDGIGGGK